MLVHDDDEGLRYDRRRLEDSFVPRSDETGGSPEGAALRTLHEVVARVSRNLDLTATLQAVADGVVAALGFGVAVVNVVRPDGDLEVAAVAGNEDARAALLGERGSREMWDLLINKAERWGSLCFLDHTSVEAGDEDMVPTWIPDVAATDDADGWHPLDALFAPMCGEDAALVGVLSVDLPVDGRRPDPLHLELLEIFAAQAAIAVNNARVHSRVAGLLARLSAIVDSAPVAICETDLDGRIRLWNSAAEEMFGWHRDEVLGQVLADVNGAALSPPTVQMPVRRNEGVQRHRDGREIHVDTGYALLRDEMGRPEGYLGVSVDVTDRTRLEQVLRRQATSDPLTALPNRLVFEDRLSRAVTRATRTGEAVGVLLVDLDGFKQVNDRYGHAFGDKVLSQLARRLTHCVREADTVARLGGDEFVILTEGDAIRSHAAEIATRVLDAMRRPLVSEDGSVQLGASVGIAVLDGRRDPAGAEVDLVQQADAAMYEAKALGKNRFCWYVDDRVLSIGAGPSRRAGGGPPRPAERRRPGRRPTQ